MAGSITRRAGGVKHLEGPIGVPDSESVREKPFARGMGILPMRPRAILALQLDFFLRTGYLA